MSRLLDGAGEVDGKTCSVSSQNWLNPSVKQPTIRIPIGNKQLHPMFSDSDLLHIIKRKMTTTDTEWGQSFGDRVVHWRIIASDNDSRCRGKCGADSSSTK
ncbi:hypothetical protein CA13_33190 [Planctomycetes bacterium CA13]|uniref:Uncharacterized protein n=1 Tax=Novipirellula herctigrandis TaxID=2527986 RepID=A0A5C5Z3S6_9BACT|nr:hypothetical protein CA13_33190 [Planctomycetes bacterium CA13]